MEDLNEINEALREFILAYQTQEKNNGVQPKNEHLITPNRSSVLISFPHLIEEVINIFRNLKTHSSEELSKEDNEFLEVLEEVIHNFPKWTVRLLGEKIRIKLLQFLDTNDLELSVDEKNKIYGSLGDIAFGAYLTDYKHLHPLLKELRNHITKSSLLGRIDFMLKLMRYDKNDLNHITNVTVYMSDVNPLTLTSDYIHKAKLIEDFDKIQGYVDLIKSKTEWNHLRASNFFSNLLDVVKLYISKINYSEALLEQLVKVLEDKGISKTTSYVFLNDTLYPFIDGLKSEEEILLSISENNDATTQANINRRKKRAVDNILSRKG